MIYATPCPVLLLPLWFISVLFFAAGKSLYVSIHESCAIIYPLNNSLGEVNSARPAMRRSSLNFRNTYIWTSARYRIILRIRAPRCNENIISANFAGRERVPRDLNLTSFKWRRISAVKRDMTRHGRQHDKWDVLKVLRISWTFDKKPEIRKNDPAIVRFLLVTLSNVITRNEGSLFVYRGKKLIV